MDTPEKLKELHEYCDEHNTCTSCILSSDCRLNNIDEEISCIYARLKTLQGIKSIPIEDSTVEKTNTTETPAAPPTEDGTAAGASHYLACPIQPIDLMQDILTKEELIGFLKGNIIKYSFRAGHKGDPEKDKQKALQYKKWLDAVLHGTLINV